MQRIKVYACTANSDTVEGRGVTIVVGYFTSRADAEKVLTDERYSKKWGPMGMPVNPRYNLQENILVVYDSPTEFWDKHDTEKHRRTGLAKLTKQEREALGLEDE